MRTFRIQAGVWVPTQRQGATILDWFECEAVDFNDAYNQYEEHLDERFGDEWEGWISEFDGFLNENGKGWDWDFMKKVRNNPTTPRIERSMGTAATVADILGIPAHQVEAI